jgi:hypothetical protein
MKKTAHESQWRSRAKTLAGDDDEIRHEGWLTKQVGDAITM